MFFSKNLTPNEGRNYLTVNVSSDGALATITPPKGEAIPLKENKDGKGYNAIVDGYRIFAKERETKFGPAVVVDVVENNVQPKEHNPEEKKTYGAKSFARK